MVVVGLQLETKVDVVLEQHLSFPLISPPCWLFSQVNIVFIINYL